MKSLARDGDSDGDRRRRPRRRPARPRLRSPAPSGVAGRGDVRAHAATVRPTPDMTGEHAPARPRLGPVDDDRRARQQRPAGPPAAARDGWSSPARSACPSTSRPPGSSSPALITCGFAATVEREVPGLGPWRYAVSLTFAVLLYVSVLVHELSHTVVALRVRAAGAADQPAPARRRVGDRAAGRHPGPGGRHRRRRAAGLAAGRRRGLRASASCSTRARSAACWPGP